MLKTKPYLTWTDETSAAAGCVEKATRTVGQESI